MLNIDLFRDNPEIVLESQRRRFASVEAVDEIINLDKELQTRQLELEKLRKDFEEDATDAEKTKKSIAEKEVEVQEARKLLNSKLETIGNLVHVSVSTDEAKNVVVRTWGEKRVEPKLKNYSDLIHLLGIADFKKGADEAGGRGFYLKGDGVHLNQALINFGLEFLENREYTLLQTPSFMIKDIMSKCAQSTQLNEELYKVTGEGDSKYPIASTLCAYHIDDWIQPTQLPLRYAGYSSCFRKEAGSHVRDTQMEQFCITTPNDNDSGVMHEEMLKNSEEFYKELNIPYQIVSIASGALNAAAAKKYNLEAWFPASETYRELASCSNCTDYLARKLEIRYGQKRSNEKLKEYVHTLNSTLTATERTICCILENNQKEDGVAIPKVLSPFMGGKTFLPFKNQPNNEATGEMKTETVIEPVQRNSSPFQAQKKIKVFNEQWKVNRKTLNLNWKWDDIWEPLDRTKYDIKSMVKKFKVTQFKKQMNLLEDIMKLIAHMHHTSQLDSHSFELNKPLLEELITAGIIPMCLNFTKHQDARLTTYAIIVLNNLICTNHSYAQLVLDADGVPIILKALSSTTISDEFKKDYLLLLGNLSLYSSDARKKILYEKEGFEFTKLSCEGPAIASTLVWIIHNLSQDPVVKYHDVICMLHVLLDIIKRFSDGKNEVITVDACAALSYISSGAACGRKNTMKAIVMTGRVPELVMLLRPGCLHSKAIVPILETIGNVLITRTDQIKVALKNDILNNLLLIFLSPSQDQIVLQEACWVISCIIAGDSTLVKDIDKRFICSLVQFAESNLCICSAVHVLSIAAAYGSSEQIECLVENHFVELICKNLLLAQENLILIMLEGLYNVLNAGDVTIEGPNYNVEQFTLCGGWETILVLQSKKLKDISEIVAEIFERYWVPQLDMMYNKKVQADAADRASNGELHRTDQNAATGEVHRTDQNAATGEVHRTDQNAATDEVYRSDDTAYAYASTSGRD